jgi:hypothetical protein
MPTTKEHSEVIDGDAVEEPGQEVALREAPQVGGVLAVRDPGEMIAQATLIANHLQSVVEKAGLISNIAGKAYPRVEAWTTLATLVGCSARTEWTKPVLDTDGKQVGWEAAVEVVNSHGVVIGRAEAECLRSERNWSGRDDFALRSMAQTRATGKALRIPLGWIAVLAGYEATPAEEMGDRSTDNKVAEPATTEAKPAAEPKLLSDAQRKKIQVLKAKVIDPTFTDEQWREWLQKEFQVGSTTELTSQAASRLIERLVEAEKKQAATA